MPYLSTRFLYKTQAINSDKLADKNATLVLKVMGFKGRILNAFEKQLDIKSNASAIYFK